MSSSPLRLRWSRTREGLPADFVCHSPDADMTGQVGRIYKGVDVRAGDVWRWHFYGTIGYCRSAGDTSGNAATKEEAARAVEDRWFAWLQEARDRGLIRMHEGNRHEWPEISRHNGKAMGRLA